MEPILTTPAALRRAAQTWPDGVAVADDQWSDRPTVELTWSEFAEEVRTFAAALVASGIAAGDRVAIWSPNSHHWPVAALGTHYAGALTLSPMLVNEEMIEGMRAAGYDDGEILEINQVTAYFGYANRTVLGLGCSTEGDILGLSPNNSDSPDDWSHR